MSDRSERGVRLRRALADADLDLLIVALPSNVALTTGYFPVVGTAIALFSSAGRLILLAPADELALAQQSRADAVRGYHPGSLDRLTRATEAVEPLLAKALADLRGSSGRIGLEAGPALQPSSYASVHLFLDSLPVLIRRLAPEATLVPADALLAAQRAVLTPAEIDRVRTAVHLVADAFEAGRAVLRPGLAETDLAAAFRAGLGAGGAPGRGVERGDGFVYCMSGPNAAEAGSAYARSHARRIQPGDLVLVHCNSFVDGLWTDVTRTYVLGRPTDQQQALYQAVFRARDAALRSIRPGVRGREVDAAARGVLDEAGWGSRFTHSTGHGVGFAAIDHAAVPRLHPRSDDLLEPGMVCNVEPAVYLSGETGLRHCDLILVTEYGAEVLTPFQQTLEELRMAAPG
ncbi:MAG TPA: Xaa-Pro peptidase family protein [Gemmatimonadales bacterium]|nr:Xaa-Pro peptidase family protein [Gemmatimonadales bacterium]